MSEPVNAAAFFSNERDAATSLHMSEPVNAAAFFSPFEPSPRHSKPFAPSSYEGFRSSLLLPAYQRTYEADQYLSRTYLTHSATIATTSPARVLHCTYSHAFLLCS